MQIDKADFGVILTTAGDDLFGKRDESPGIFFQKFGQIWARFMSESQIVEWWIERFGKELQFDEQGRLVVLPTPEQLVETLLKVKELQNHWHDTFDDYWDDARLMQAAKDKQPVPQKPTRIDAPYESQLPAIMRTESEWRGKPFIDLFRSLKGMKQFRVSTYLIFANLWHHWNPKESMSIDPSNAAESLRRRREYSRIQMQKMRAELKSSSGFGEHSKELTQRMVQFQNDAKQQDKLREEIESLQDKLTRIAERYHSNFHWLQNQFDDPLTHSESQHSRLEKLLSDIDSTF